VGGDVVAGTVDRLLVTPERILVIDFKTGRRVPSGIDTVPRHHLAQMGAYAAALAIVFPGRTIEAALLYTAGPELIIVPEQLLEAHKPGFTVEEQKQGIGG
jgi:ATP-dependent helicase/nuclease subunit A